MSNLLLRRRMMMGKHEEPVIPTMEFAFTRPNRIINMSNGADTYNASWAGTDYIEVPSGFTKMTFTNTYGAQIAFRGAFYDADKVFVTSQFTSIWGPFNNGGSGTRNIPSTAKYFKVSTGKSYLTNIGTDTVIVTLSN